MIITEDLDSNIRQLTQRSLILLLGILCAVSVTGSTADAQYSAYQAYQKQMQNSIGVADTAVEKLLSQRMANRSIAEPQALEGPVDPNTYILGPGDGVYLDVFSAHALDQDLTITPEGKILVPGTGEINVAGLSVTEAEKRVNALLARTYRNPQASLSLRKLRPIKVSVLGELLNPGVQTMTALQRVSEVIEKSGGFKATSSLRNIEIRTMSGKLRAKADLVNYFSGYDPASNPYLEAGDIVIVPKMERLVTISGAVTSPGTFEFVEGDSLSTLIRLARGLIPGALLDSIEVARFSAQDPIHAHRFYVDYTNGHDIPLREGDVVAIRGLSQYHVPHVVSVGGEFRYPGRYAIEVGQTKLSDVISRAGGLLKDASLEEASVLRRVGVGSWEQDPEWLRLERLGQNNMDRMTNDEYNYYIARMRQLGRQAMVVDFKKLLLDHDTSQDILLREEDSIWVPRARGFVNVTGSVNNQGNVLLIKDGSYLDYIRRAGGFTSDADRSAVRIINSRTSSYIDPRSEADYPIGPGDTIVVPAERSDFWKNFALTTAITAQVLTIIAGVLLILQKR